MIMVCAGLEERLDHLWIDLQNELQRRHARISQIDLDEACVEMLEKLVRREVVNAENRRREELERRR